LHPYKSENVIWSTNGKARTFRYFSFTKAVWIPLSRCDTASLALAARAIDANA
jgi:hypothetical protein